MDCQLFIYVKVLLWLAHPTTFALPSTRREQNTSLSEKISFAEATGLKEGIRPTSYVRNYQGDDDAEPEAVQVSINNAL